MPLDLSSLAEYHRVLFSIPLEPLQGHRFQPTGFPNLGAATYQTAKGQCLLVESAQSMANRLESVCWDVTKNAPVEPLAGISHVTVTRKKTFLTDSMLEAHRINSPYILEGTDKGFFGRLKGSLGGLERGPVDRGLLARTLMRYDIGSLVHGVFLAKKELAGGRLRVARALSCFVESEGVRVVASGGVKNDFVNPSGDAKSGFGNVPFARDEYTAERTTLYANFDLAQLRGYGLGDDATRLLMVLSLYKLRRLLDGNLRFRTACDLHLAQSGEVIASWPKNFKLPDGAALQAELPKAIAACARDMEASAVTFDGELKKGKEDKLDRSMGEDEDPGA